MVQSDPWHVTREGDPADLVLTVDFFAPGRAEAAFTDLVPKLGGGFTVWETRQPGLGAEAGMSGDDYVARWVDALPDGARIRGVLGFCVGGIYGSAISEAISRRQGHYPPTVLFDPEPISPLVLYFQFHKLLDKLSTVLTEDELQQAQEAGFQTQDTADDLVALGDTLTKLYREYGDTGLARVGLDEPRRHEMMSWFDSYMGYLVGASQVTTARDVTTSVVISSDTPVNGLHFGARELPFAIDRHELLRRDEVATAVSDLLG